MRFGKSAVLIFMLNLIAFFPSQSVGFQESLVDTDSEEWTEAIDGLRFRLNQSSIEKINQVQVVKLQLEIRNDFDRLAPVVVSIEPEDVVFELKDALGNEIKPTNGPRSGPTFGWGELNLPYNSTISLGLHCDTVGISTKKGVLLALPEVDWFLRDGSDTFYIQAKVRVRAVCDDDNIDETIELPVVSINIGRREDK